jgi:hypothetical protein
MEDIVRPSVPLPFSAAPNARRSLSKQDWNDHRATFERLYSSERKTLKEVMKIMEQDYGFLATSVPICSRSRSLSLIVLAQENLLTSA